MNRNSILKKSNNISIFCPLRVGYKLNRFILARAILVHCFAPILFGAVLYFFWGSPNLAIYEWLNFNPRDINSERLHDIFLKAKKIIPSWILYILPDGLWAYSFTSAIIILWEGELKKIQFWLFVPFFVGVLVELLQFSKIIGGTFDFLDILSYLLGTLLGVYILHIKPAIK